METPEKCGTPAQGNKFEEIVIADDLRYWIPEGFKPDSALWEKETQLNMSMGATSLEAARETARVHFAPKLKACGFCGVLCEWDGDDGLHYCNSCIRKYKEVREEGRERLRSVFGEVPQITNRVNGFGIEESNFTISIDSTGGMLATSFWRVSRKFGDKWMVVGF